MQCRRRRQRRAFAALCPCKGIDGGEEDFFYLVFTFAEQIGDQRRTGMRARQGKTECLRLRPVQTGVIADRIQHGLAGIGVVAIEKQSFDPGACKRFIAALIRGDFEECQRIANIAHRQQTLNTQRDKICIQRLADRHTRAGNKQPAGHVPQCGRAEPGRHTRHQPTDDGPLRAPPERQREAALILADQPDSVGIDGLQPVYGDPRPIERARRHSNPRRHPRRHTGHGYGRPNRCVCRRWCFDDRGRPA